MKSQKHHCPVTTIHIPHYMSHGALLCFYVPEVTFKARKCSSVSWWGRFGVSLSRLESDALRQPISSCSTSAPRTRCGGRISSNKDGRCCRRRRHSLRCPFHASLGGSQRLRHELGDVRRRPRRDHGHLRASAGPHRQVGLGLRLQCPRASERRRAVEEHQRRTLRPAAARQRRVTGRRGRSSWNIKGRPYSWSVSLYVNNLWTSSRRARCPPQPSSLIRQKET